MPTLALTTLSNHQPSNVRWLWPGRIPIGKLTMLCGDPGLGKSFLTLDMAARLSVRAPWPDCPSEDFCPLETLVISAEDDAADTILPRVVAAGGDPSRIKICHGVRMDEAARYEGLLLPDDIATISQTLATMGRPSLMIIDPLSAYLGDADTHSNSVVRGIMMQLQTLAEEYGMAIVCITHLNKSQGVKAVYRQMGSLAFTAAARMVWQVGKMPGSEEQRVLALVKSNLATNTTALTFRIKDGRVDWTGSAGNLSADALEVATPEEAEGLPDAHEFLSQVLMGGPRRVTEIFAEGASMGLSERTLKRAKRGMGVVSRRISEDAGAHWVWLPPSAPNAGAKADSNGGAR